MSKYQKVLFVIIVVLFLATRLAGIDQIYHQDEYRWATQADPGLDYDSPHPPLTKYTLRIVGNFFGFEHLRYVPLFFSFLGLLLLYKVVRKSTQKVGVALIAMFLYTISVYGAIAGLQIDIDGAVLPFFVLLGYYAYINLLKDRRSKYWLVIFGLALVGGFLSKLSFILFIGAVTIDYFIRLYVNDKNNAKKILRNLLFLVGPLIIIGGAFYYFYSVISDNIIGYASSFNSLNFTSRAYFQLAFKIFKSLFWLSPLLLLPTLFGLFRKEFIVKYRFWYIYLGLSLIFYIVIFDFARLTVERYLMFLIMPSIIISSDVLYSMLRGISLRSNRKYIFITVIFFILFAYSIFMLNYDVLPLNPKIDYINHVKALDFNFLIPFTGGSGPVGFYFSAQFIMWSWIISVIAITLCYCAKKYKNMAIIILMVFGIGYNALFVSEYLFGSIFGSVPSVARQSINYVNDDADIERVITYYDIGAYYLQNEGKYSSRFYTAPSRDYTEKLSTYSGHYMIVDFPSIDKDGRYWLLLDECNKIKEFDDKYVKSYILDCKIYE